MSKSTKIIITIILIILAISYFLGFFIGNYLYKSKIDLDYSLIQDIEEKEEPILNEEVKEVSLSNNKITENTKIVYEYVYKEDNFIETFEDLPPYYLIGVERNELEKIFNDWSIVLFSSQKVILQKSVEGEGNKIYFLSVYNGNIAIFSKDELIEENLIEVTNKPIISLPEDEQEKIKNGIYIKGRLELMKYIQDYES